MLSEAHGRSLIGQISNCSSDGHGKLSAHDLQVLINRTSGQLWRRVEKRPLHGKSCCEVFDHWQRVATSSNKNLDGSGALSIGLRMFSGAFDRNLQSLLEL